MNCLPSSKYWNFSNAVTISFLLQSAVEEWGLKKSQPIAITTDNASNIVSGINSISSEFSPHIRCFAHTLNLATQKAIKCQQVDRVAARIRRIVPFFHKSSTATAIMESKQHLLELPKHKLIQDVSTRWNSTYDMFSRYIEQQPAVFATLLSKDRKKNWKILSTCLMMTWKQPVNWSWCWNLWKHLQLLCVTV